MDRVILQTLRQRLRHAACLLALCLPALVAAQEQTTTRVVEYNYDATTGLLIQETVDPGLGHCAETHYAHDEYGNRRRTLVQPCASTAAEARFEPRLTLNEFSAKTDGSAHLRYAAGAFQTRSRTGSASMESGAEPPASEARAEHHPGFGTTLVKTEVAHRNTALNVSTRTEPDSFGRVLREYAPVVRNADGSVAETHVEYRTVYCQGSKAASPDAACINVQASQSISVSYASRMLVNTSGDAVSSFTPQFVSAYFVEATPRDSTGTVIGARSRIHYDSLHREVAKETETYGGQWSMALVAYDPLGMEAAKWSPYFGRNSTGAFVLPPEELMQSTAARDVMHRPTEQVKYWRAQAGQPTAAIRVLLAYNGLETRATVPGDSTPDGGERTSATHKYPDGKTALTVDPYGYTIRSAYDPVGNLVRTVDLMGNATEVTYTAGTARFKESMNDPNQGTWRYAYDAIGQLKLQTDAKGATTQMVYDVLGRLTQKLNPTQNSAWYYDRDAQGNWCAGGLGRLCEATAGNNPLISRQVHTYDNLGRAVQTSTTLDRTYVSQTTFDARGRVDTVRYPTGFTLKYAYSGGGNGRVPGVLEKVFDNADASRVFWRIDTVSNPADVFDARGNLRRTELGNGVGTNNTYDPVSGKVFVLQAGTSTLVFDHRYTYDKADNVAARDEKINAISEAFVHDVLNRLKQYQVRSVSDIAADRTVSISYNAVGNVVYKSDVGSYTYAAGGAARPHAVLSAGGTNYEYDANGHVTATTGAQVRSHTWTSFNQPETMSYSGKSVTFTYDHDYKRVKEVVNDGSKTRTLYLVHPDNRGGLAYEREEVVNGGTTTYENRHYISAAGAVIAVVETQGTASTPLNGTVSSDPNLTQYWHKDALGSIVAVSRGDGGVLERMAFDPWGRRLRNTAVVDPAYEAQGPAHGDRGFTGHEHLDELGLIHMNGRIYDPVLARFLSPDPIIQSPDDLQNYNRYSYVVNNPLTYTDPDGNCFGPLVAACAAVKMFAVIAGTAMILDGNKHWKMVGSILLAGGLSGAGGLVEQGLHIPASAVENAFVSGYLSGLVASNGDLGSALISGVTAAGFNGAGKIGYLPLKVITHALVGCASQAIQGGKCGPGAMAAAFGKLATAELPQSAPGGLVIVTIVGGTASVIGGGKFANGAVGAAFGYLFNYMSSRWLRAVVPGQIQFDHGMTAIEEGRFGAASLHFGAMLGEQVATVLSFGEYGAASAAGRAMAAQWESRFVFQTEHMARHLEGTGLAVDVVKQSIMNDLKAAKYNVGELIKRDIVVGGQELRYHAFPLKDGSFRIGTIGTPPYGQRF